ncbi:hypothetical protein DL766_008612 [Monosporascus sp. MC13-8B]|nr:hypothetical protein DL763_004620 [Monosporascus cannonballus]RYP18714.1 hypothetical protein DL766_008612 [Monosporascus sp. MC13-8B]
MPYGLAFLCFRPASGITSFKSLRSLCKTTNGTVYPEKLALTPEPESPTNTGREFTGNMEPLSLAANTAQPAHGSSEPKCSSKADANDKGAAEDGEITADAQQEQERGEEHEVKAILDHRAAEGERGAIELLVHWVGETKEEATWEPEEEIQKGAAGTLYDYWKSKGCRGRALFNELQLPEEYRIFKVLRHERRQKSLRNAQATLVIQGKTTIQDLLRELKDQFAPSPLSIITTVREDYRKALRLAEVGRMNPDQWHKTWFTAYTRAKAYSLQEVKGPLAAKDFLSAVGKRLAPEWGQRELTNLIRDDSLGRLTITLKEFGDWFSAMCHEHKLRVKTYLRLV